MPEQKRLICIGEAWVDPKEVIAIDSMFDDESPDWVNVRVEVVTGTFVYGTRAPERVVAAVRNPGADTYDEANNRESDGKLPPNGAERARRRQAPAISGPSSLRAMPPLTEEGPRGS